MKLYMVRHGQSETNLARRFTGWAQVNLTEKGLEDARRAGEYLKGLTFDRIYSSDLVRAVQTAQAAIPGCRPIQLDCLREISVGELEWQHVDECAVRYGENFHEHRRNLNFVPYGGEDQSMMENRVRRFLQMLEADPCEQAVAFVHAGVVQTTLDLVLGMKVDRSHLRCHNGSVAVFEYEGGRWLLHTWGAAV